MAKATNVKNGVDGRNKGFLKNILHRGRNAIIVAVAASFLATGYAETPDIFKFVANLKARHGVSQEVKKKIRDEFNESITLRGSLAVKKIAGDVIDWIFGNDNAESKAEFDQRHREAAEKAAGDFIERQFDEGRIYIDISQAPPVSRPFDRVDKTKYVFNLIWIKDASYMEQAKRELTKIGMQEYLRKYVDEGTISKIFSYLNKPKGEKTILLVFSIDPDNNVKVIAEGDGMDDFQTEMMIIILKAVAFE